MTEIATPPLAARPGFVASVRRQLAARADLVRYVLIGGTAFLLDVGLFTVLHLGAAVDPLVANTVAVFVSMLFSFSLNAFANFKVRDRLLTRFVSFVVVCGIGYLLSMGILWLLISVFGIHPVAAKLVSLPVVLVVQFLANKHVTFGSVLFSASERTPHEQHS